MVCVRRTGPLWLDGNSSLDPERKHLVLSLQEWWYGRAARSELSGIGHHQESGPLGIDPLIPGRRDGHILCLCAGSLTNMIRCVDLPPGVRYGTSPALSAGMILVASGL